MLLEYFALSFQQKPSKHLQCIASTLRRGGLLAGLGHRGDFEYTDYKIMANFMDLDGTNGDPKNKKSNKKTLLPRVRPRKLHQEGYIIFVFPTVSENKYNIARFVGPILVCFAAIFSPNSGKQHLVFLVRIRGFVFRITICPIQIHEVCHDFLVFVVEITHVA